MIGLSLTEVSVSAAVIAAVFFSNLPEAIAATTGLAQARWSRRKILGLWALVTAVSGLSALAGYGLLSDASPGTVAFVLAFAGGALLTMLADTMMPEAFKRGRQARRTCHHTRVRPGVRDLLARVSTLA